MIELDMDYIVGLAKKCPKTFTRQRIALWRHRINQPSVNAILRLAASEGITDMNRFFINNRIETETRI